MDGDQAQALLSNLQRTNYFYALKPTVINDLQEWQIECEIRRNYLGFIGQIKSLCPTDIRVRARWPHSKRCILTYF